MSKIISTINFTDKTLTIEKGATILKGEQLILKVIDPLGTTLYVNTGFVTSDFSSPDIDENETDTLEVDLPVDDNDKILQGTYTIYYNSYVGGKYSTGQMTVRYCIEIPTVELSLDYTCRNSTIISTDSTDYDIYCSCSNSDVTPSITRTHTVVYPKTMLTPIADVVSANAVVTVTPIWTKYWYSRVSSVLSYTMPADSYTGSTLYFITGTVEGLADSTVVCDDCLCLLYECISSIIDKYFSIQNTASPTELARYQTTLFDIQTLYMQFRLSEGCETEADTRAICGQIRAIVGAWDCECDTTLNSAYSVEIVPMSGGSSTSVSGTNIYNGDGVPLVSLGNNGDYYFNNLNGDVYKKVLGAWVVQFSMTLTALVSNHLLESDNASKFSFLDVYTELKSIEFDVTDVQDGSVLQLAANVSFDEPTGDDTAIRVDLVGTNTNSLTIPIDADFNGTQFPMTLEVEYYVNGGKIFGRMYKLFSTTGLFAYGYEPINITLQATLTPNEINFLVKSDDNITFIYLNNIRLNHLRTV